MRAASPARSWSLPEAAWPLLATLAWLAACDAPLGYTRCRVDEDCPASHRCDVARSVCAPGLSVDAAGLDAIGLDLPVADRVARDVPPADAGGTDAAGADAVSVDTTGADTAATEDGGTTGDSGGVDMGAVDVTGGDAASGADLGPRPPQAMVTVAPGVYPGESVTWQATADDPDGPEADLVATWSLLETVAGVALEASAATPLSPRFLVDRTVYEGGPADRSIRVRLVVTDVQGLSADLEVELVVLDERGPYADATSPWHGVGYDGANSARHGYCGALAHPCHDIQDAIDNLHHAQFNDGLWSDLHEVRVASSGTYAIVGPLHLGGNALSCGWNAGFTSRLGSTPRSRIEFTGDMGVQVLVSTAIDGCAIVGITPLNAVGASRIGVSAVDAGLVLRNSKVVGSVASPAVTTLALGVDLVSTGVPQFSNIQDSEIEGGIGSVAAVGLNLYGGRIRIAGCTVRGGQATSVAGAVLATGTFEEATRSTVEDSVLEGGEAEMVADSSAIGLAIVEGNPRVLAGTVASGGSSGETVIGLSVGVSATGVHVASSTFTGLTSGAPVAAYGALVRSTLNSDHSHYLGGEASYATGLAAWCDVGDQLALGMVEDLVEGGLNPATGTGLALGSGVTTAITNGVLRGSADSSTALFALGLWVGAGAQAVLAESTLRSGMAASSARGAHVEAAAVGLTLDRCDLEAGSSGRAAAETLGIEHAGDALVVVGGSVRALAGDLRSRGILVSAPAGTTLLSMTQVQAGQALGATGTSMGLELSSGPLTVDDGTGGGATQIVAGNATLSSVGALLDLTNSTVAAGRHELSGCSIGSGRAAVSTGLQLVAVNATEIAGCTLSSGTATTGRSTALLVDNGAQVQVEGCDLQAGTGQSQSAGLWVDRDCDRCLVQRNTVRGGAVSDNNVGQSIGMRLARRDAGGSNPTLVHGNHVVAGSAAQAYGVVVAGNGAWDLRVLNNSIEGGGRSGGTSAGVLLGDPVLAGAPTRVAVLVGNIIGAGIGATSHNIVENGTCQGASSTWAEPVVVTGGRNNNLWPAGASGLLADFAANSNPCTTSVSSVTAVNQIAPYAENPVVADDKTWSVDPQLQGDGVTLGSGSPMVDRAYDTALAWPGTGADGMRDFFGVARPLGNRHDIGAHELR